MTTPDNSTHGKLVDKLRELFELDKADLDFGIYRIISQRQDEIDDLLRNQLKTTVNGLLTSAQGNPQRLEDAVYEHLYRFFSRYYEEGDFISLRRVSRKAKYAIPYNGEEVKLHWANANQYYIKSSENFRDYRFTLADGRGVHFKLLDADTSRDNTKGDKRFFVLADESPVEVHAGELRVHFHYTTTAEKKITDTDGKAKAASQGVFNNLALVAMLHDVAKVAPGFQATLSALQPTKANPKRTLLEKHLTDYTAKNSFDYFIHKDLGGFLRQELDFYIKNEVVYLDDIDHPARDGDAEKALTHLQETLQKVRAVRKVAGKVIDFLAQLEDFQKKLWLKKKFVVGCDYCLTLNRVPESLYAAIAGNAAQVAEWRKWGFIDADTVVNMALLRSQPFLMVDTRFYPAAFKFELLASIDDIDAQCDGLLINADNFQALNLLQDRYREQVKCIYIDPPYNTDASAIMYKNGYKSSSWASLMNDRIRVSHDFLNDKGVLVAAIDDVQQKELGYIINDNFGGNTLGTVCVRSNPSGRPTQTGYSVSHEYLIFAGKTSSASIGRLPPTEQQASRFNQVDENGKFEWRNLRREGSNSDRSARKQLYYPIYIHEQKIRVPKMIWNIVTESWMVDEKPLPNEQIAYPDNEQGEQKTWRWEGKTVMASLSELAVRKDRSGRDYIYCKRRPNKDGVVSVSSWFDAKYSATEHGTALLKKLDIKFSYPKSIYAVSDAIYISGASNQNCLVLDYFGGSGTTGHAVINLNREDGGSRKYILVEQGAYFDTVLKPRIQKVVYSENWKDGKPTAKDASQNPHNGISHCFKYMRLESYEDTLNNLELKRSGEQQSLLAANPAVKEDYLLHYWLNIEAQGSLLNIDAFTHPFDYQLHIAGDSTGATRQQAVDLVETFNYLLGLTLYTQRTDTLTVTCAPDQYGVWQHQKHTDSAQAITAEYTFLSIHGTLPDGKSALLIWRILNDFNQPISKTCHNIALDHFLLERQRINPREGELDVIYVNGDNTLPNIRTEEQHWKVRLIEEEFQRLMFAAEV